MVDFIRALRASGVRISLAETEDAMHGIDHIGLYDIDQFRMALKSSIVKEHNDQPLFDYFFPLFFSSNKPPMDDILDQLTPEERQMLGDFMQNMMSQMHALRDLLQRLLEGRPFTDEELEQMANQSGLPNGDEMYMRQWFERRMNRQAGIPQMERFLEQLLDALEEMGMDGSTREQMEQQLRENLQGLSDQVSQFVGQTLAENMAEREPDQKPDLLDVPLSRLTQGDIDDIRDEIRRLAARLRSRAALRQKRAKSGDFDPRKTMRSNMRYGGVPIVMKFRNKHKKPSLILICDLSTSMRYSVEFLLTMVYELQDQVRKTNSFIFISDMVDVSMDLNEFPAKEAVEKVLLEKSTGLL